jgi:hypothetical protein
MDTPWPYGNGSARRFREDLAFSAVSYCALVGRKSVQRWRDAESLPLRCMLAGIRRR